MFLNTYIPNPIAFSLFGIDIRWYGILIALGMLCAVFLTYRRAPLHGIESDKVFDFVIIAIPLGIVGARIYYVAFEWENYAGDLRKILDIRGGGLAIHGGLIFAFLTVFLLCRRWKIGFFDAMDSAVPGIALAQAIGRWGNYFNSEAHGGPTDLPWAIPVNGEMVHPTFLYESLWCFFLCFLLIAVDNRRKFSGQTCLLYAAFYSLERIFVESLRTDSLMLGPFKQAQLFSGCVIALSAVIYINLRRKSLSAAAGGSAVVESEEGETATVSAEYPEYEDGARGEASGEIENGAGAFGSEGDAEGANGENTDE